MRHALPRLTCLLPLIGLIAGCGSTQSPQPSPSRAAASVDPAAAQRRTEYETVRTQLLQATAEVDALGGFRGDGKEKPSGDYCSVFLDGYVPAKSTAQAREKVTAALRADGWKQTQSGGTDESLLTRGTWAVFVTRTTAPLTGADGKTLHELTIKADCEGNA
ncbi:hypothetical protein AB0F46_33505 [Streptomyces sp. NPDC026665]|uniref:hypothetical protein n=1 Tax=Streptomyces sp. NPDC026665 TaxID=3154798 RepID=UPI0033D3C1BE